MASHERIHRADQLLVTLAGSTRYDGHPATSAAGHVDVDQTGMLDGPRYWQCVTAARWLRAGEKAVVAATAVMNKLDLKGRKPYVPPDPGAGRW
jgi:hypothetical protein